MRSSMSQNETILEKPVSLDCRTAEANKSTCPTTYNVSSCFIYEVRFINWAMYGSLLFNYTVLLYNGIIFQNGTVFTD